MSIPSRQYPHGWGLLGLETVGARVSRRLVFAYLWEVRVIVRREVKSHPIYAKVMAKIDQNAVCVYQLGLKVSKVENQISPLFFQCRLF